MHKAFALLLVVLSSLSLSGMAAAAPAPEKLTPTTVTVHDEQEGLVSLNTADAETLQKRLKGIGKAKAEAIVAYRQANGPFTSLDQLLEVKGIGKAILESNREAISLD